MTKHDAYRADDILAVIEEFIAEFGHPPSIRDIIPRVGLASTSSVYYHLKRLEKDQRIVRCGCGCQRPMPVAA